MDNPRCSGELNWLKEFGLLIFFFFFSLHFPQAKLFLALLSIFFALSFKIITISCTSVEDSAWVENQLQLAAWLKGEFFYLVSVTRRQWATPCLFSVGCDFAQRSVTSSASDLKIRLKLSWWASCGGEGKKKNFHLIEDFLLLLKFRFSFSKLFFLLFFKYFILYPAAF